MKIFLKLFVTVPFHIKYSSTLFHIIFKNLNKPNSFRDIRTLYKFLILIDINQGTFTTGKIFQIIYTNPQCHLLPVNTRRPENVQKFGELRLFQLPCPTHC